VDVISSVIRACSFGSSIATLVHLGRKGVRFRAIVMM